jgi:hypothetical protein
MDDRTVQRKLNQLTRLANELHGEAVRRYGDEAGIYYASGYFNMMAGADPELKLVRFKSNGLCHLDSGDW